MCNRHQLERVMSKILINRSLEKVDVTKKIENNVHDLLLVVALCITACGNNVYVQVSCSSIQQCICHCVCGSFASRGLTISLGMGEVAEDGLSDSRVDLDVPKTVHYQFSLHTSL